MKHQNIDNADYQQKQRQEPEHVSPFDHMYAPSRRRRANPRVPKNEKNTIRTVRPAHSFSEDQGRQHRHRSIQHHGCIHRSKLDCRRVQQAGQPGPLVLLSESRLGSSEDQSLTRSVQGWCQRLRSPYVCVALFMRRLLAIKTTWRRSRCVSSDGLLGNCARCSRQLRRGRKGMGEVTFGEGMKVLA